LPRRREDGKKRKELVRRLTGKTKRVAALACNGEILNHGDRVAQRGTERFATRREDGKKRKELVRRLTGKTKRVAPPACNGEIFEPRGQGGTEGHAEICHEGAKTGRNAKSCETGLQRIKNLNHGAAQRERRKFVVCSSSGGRCFIISDISWDERKGFAGSP
jgi:hypothetical protein